MNRLLTIVDSKYQRLEYLESTGTQYIDTGVKGNQDTNYKIKFQSLEKTGYNFGGVLCSRFSANYNRLSIITGDAGTGTAPHGTEVYVNNGTNTNQISFKSLEAYGVRIVEKNGNNVTLNGDIRVFPEQTTYTTPTTLKLGCVDTNGTLSSFFNGKIWYCQIYDNDVLVRNFVPVLRKTDNELGMLDLVEGKFYTNAGTGKFTANLDTMYAIIQGSPTQSPYGVFSGFSASNYLALQENFSLTPTTKAEFVFRVSNTEFNGNSSFLGHIGSYSINFRFNTVGKLALYLGDGNSWVVNGLVGTTTFQTNIFYYAKLKFDNGVITLYSSTDGTNWTQEATTTVSLTYTYNLILGRANNTASYQSGSIDLPNSYIKLGSTKYNLQAVVGYTVVGSPTIVDGVVSGFSADNYLQLGASTITDITKYYFCIKFKIENLSGVQSILGGYSSSHNFGLILYETGKIRYSFYANSSEKHIESKAYQIGDIVIARAFYSGNNTFVLETSSDDGITWETKTINVDITTLNTIRTDYPFRLGRAILNNYAWVFNGSIDMNETYIKINNKLWFNGQQA